MRQLDAWQVAKQHAVAVQRAFRRAGRAGREDHHRRIVGRGRLPARKLAAAVCKKLRENRARRRSAPSIDEHQLEVGQAIRAWLASFARPRALVTAAFAPAFAAGIRAPHGPNRAPAAPRSRQACRSRHGSRRLRHCGSSSATRSPRAMPCARSALASRFDVSRSVP